MSETPRDPEDGLPPAVEPDAPEREGANGAGELPDEELSDAAPWAE